MTKMLKGCEDEITFRLIRHLSTSDVYTDRENIFSGLTGVTSDFTLPKTTPTFQSDTSKGGKQGNEPQSHSSAIVHTLSQAFYQAHRSC